MDAFPRKESCNEHGLAIFHMQRSDWASEPINVIEEESVTDAGRTDRQEG